MLLHISVPHVYTQAVPFLLPAVPLISLPRNQAAERGIMSPKTSWEHAMASVDPKDTMLSSYVVAHILMTWPDTSERRSQGHDGRMIQYGDPVDTFPIGTFRLRSSPSMFAAGPSSRNKSKIHGSGRAASRSSRLSTLSCR